MTKKYRISAYIYTITESEDGYYFDNIEDARKELEQLYTLCPENIYKIEEVQHKNTKYGEAIEVVCEVE
ncbi:MAG: hypothetical protein KKC53_04055 [Actinobacteria bacterium]|nr:hypothetical protein [Actinomycetota bacterium]